MGARSKTLLLVAAVAALAAGAAHAQNNLDDRLGRGAGAGVSIDPRGPDILSLSIHPGPLGVPVWLVDSTGRIMGRVAPGQSGPALVLGYRGDTLVVPLSGYSAGTRSTTGLNWSTPYVYYSGPNCTGDWLIPAGSGMVGTRAVAPEQRGNQWFLLVGGNRETQRLLPSSVSNAGNNCFNSRFEQPAEVVLVDEVLSLDRVGIAPFFYR